MGCSPSAFDIACRNREFKRNLRQFETMQLSKSVVRKLFYAFKKFDMDGSGSIGLVELLTQLDLPRTKFTEKVFSIFDDDGSGEIEFKEFVLSVWNYCTLTKGNLGTTCKPFTLLILFIALHAKTHIDMLKPHYHFCTPTHRHVRIRPVRRRLQRRAVGRGGANADLRHLRQARDEEQ